MIGSMTYHIVIFLIHLHLRIEYPLTPDEDLRSFDSPLDDSFRFEDQSPLTPDEDLRSFDSPLDDSFRFEDQSPLTPDEDLRSFDSLFD